MVRTPVFENSQCRDDETVGMYSVGVCFPTELRRIRMEYSFPISLFTYFEPVGNCYYLSMKNVQNLSVNILSDSL